MRVVVDANVWISAAIRVSGPPGAVIRGIERGDLSAVMTRELLEEILDVLGRPELARFIDDEAAARLIRILATAGLTETRVSARRPRDPKDAHVIEAAVAGGADAIVTGDGGLLGDEELRAWLGERGIEVLTPAELAARLPG